MGKESDVFEVIKRNREGVSVIKFYLIGRIKS